MASSLVEKLSAIAGSENVSADPADLIAYSCDASGVEGMPDVVVWPTSTEQIARIMKLANELKVPVTPRGAGTGRSGGAVPVAGGILLVMTRMNKILSIDVENLQVSAEAGTVLRTLNETLKPHGLFLPPDPASDEVCTIGGCIAECAGGPRSFKYGTFRDWVLRLELVLPTGEMTTVGARTPKQASGYDLARLMVGSEGTLSIITKACLRVHPLPPCRAYLMSSFGSIENAIQAAVRIARERLPSALELMDQLASEAIARILPHFPRGSLLLMEVDGSDAEVKRRVERIREICQERGARVEVGWQEEGEKLWSEARKSLSPALSALKPSRIAEDVVVPLSALASFVQRAYGIAERNETTIVIYGHCGDGNLHPTLLFDEWDESSAQRAREAAREIVRASLELGGTLSGEHGIGVTKLQYMPWEHDPTKLSLMLKLKRALDPDNILNPGKIVKA